MVVTSARRPSRELTSLFCEILELVRNQMLRQNLRSNGRAICPCKIYGKSMEKLQTPLFLLVFLFSTTLRYLLRLQNFMCRCIVVYF